MSPIKSILLHLDASPRCAVRLDVARQLARRHEAGLTCVFGMSSNFVDMPFAVAESSEVGACWRSCSKPRPFRIVEARASAVCASISASRM